jgi:hypothetical protein
MTAGVRRFVALVLGLLLAGGLLPGSASAHQPVNLDSSDRSPAKGPLLLDGTVSFAVYAPLAARRMQRGFRFRMQEGQPLRLQLLITDTAPANAVPNRRQPVVLLVSPSGKRTTIRPDERTSFYEPYSRTSYLYLSRYSAVAEKGTYRVRVRARSSVPTNAVVAVGYREVPGQVRD